MGPRSNQSPTNPSKARDPQNLRATFQTRKTLADWVRDNMTLADRRTYYQRIIFVASHLEMGKDFNEQLSNVLRQKLAKTELYSHGEHISGLIMFYDGYSVYMLEGSEEALGPFLRMISNKEKELYKNNKIILTFNNINQRFFKKMCFYSADPPALLETVPMEKIEDIELQCSIVVKKIYNLCKKLNESDLLTSRSSSLEIGQLDASYNKLMPEVALIEALLTTKFLLSVKKLAGMFEAVPQFFSYDSFVWPNPFSYCPTNVFTADEYEVNLTFHKDPKKKL